MLKKAIRKVKTFFFGERAKPADLAPPKPLRPPELPAFNKWSQELFLERSKN